MRSITILVSILLLSISSLPTLALPAGVSEIVRRTTLGGSGKPKLKPRFPVPPKPNPQPQSRGLVVPRPQKPLSQKMSDLGEKNLSVHCGANRTIEQIEEMERDFMKKKSVMKRDLKKETSITINAYFHNVYASQTLEGGFIEYICSLSKCWGVVDTLPDRDDVIKRQQAVLNHAFKDLNIHLNWRPPTRTRNANWFNKVGQGNPVEEEMAKVLRKGDRASLNIYTVKQLDKNLLGYATFPSDYDKAPKRDGVYINFATVPGGSMKPYNEGMTLVHESGHWVGLFHTFQEHHDPKREGETSGCVVPGDYVADTPYQKAPTQGCPPKAPHSCGQRDPDPIHNYMDYSDDHCLNNFTPGQRQRAAEQLRVYRGL